MQAQRFCRAIKPTCTFLVLYESNRDTLRYQFYLGETDLGDTARAGRHVRTRGQFFQSFTTLFG